MINVTVWNEYRHENPKWAKSDSVSVAMHPGGIHSTVAGIVRELGDEKVNVRTATLDDPFCGLPDEVLDATDVLIWWGHVAHEEVPDELVEKIYTRVLKGMGFIALHSAHHSKIFKKLNGTSCSLKWASSSNERLFNVNPAHPIARGIPDHIELGGEECYGEFFDIAKPDDVIFEGWYDIGEVFRSGCTFTRGYGKIFYFQPGHETFASFKNPYIRRIIRNAVEWCYNPSRRDYLGAPRIINTLEDARLNGNTEPYLKYY